MILIVDNYDSFTFNLVHHFKVICIKVLRNDTPDLLKVAKEAEGIVLSPGPGRPEDAGKMPELLQLFKDKKPILGICLGHQAIVQAFGGEVIQAPSIMHGKQSLLSYKKKGALLNYDDEMLVMRYHSLCASKEKLPSELEVLAETEDTIMMIEHKTLPVVGIQFHPESFATPKGQYFIDAFIELIKRDQGGNDDAITSY